jgi:hypothetical protein
LGEPSVQERKRATARSFRDERRRHGRTPISAVRCWTPAPAVIVDASRLGLGIETGQRYQRGDGVLVTIKLAGRTGRIAGHVKWRSTSSTPGHCGLPVYRVGIKLVWPIDEGWLTALLRPSLTARAAGA